MPTISMSEADKDWAVSFACPTDAEGMYMIYGRQSCDTRKTEEGASIDVGNAKFGGQEALVVLDHVFIPNEYIFLNLSLIHILTLFFAAGQGLRNGTGGDRLRAGGPQTCSGPHG